MAQKIYQSIRRIPGRLASFRKKPDISEFHGSNYHVSVCSDYGFPAKPSCIAYDPVIDIIALLTREGVINIYGKPGVVFSASHPNDSLQYVQILFLPGTYKLITLTSTDEIHLWKLTTTPTSSIELVHLHCLPSVATHFDSDLLGGGDAALDQRTDEQSSRITALCALSDGKRVVLGTETGWIATITVIQASPREQLKLSSPDDSISPLTIQSRLPIERRQRIRVGSVGVISERPESTPVQLLIGYNSGLSLLYSLQSAAIVALLPWQHGVESVAWCGGNGLPNHSRQQHLVPSSGPPKDLGMRLLSAHSDGSLGVWRLADVPRSGSNFDSSQAPSLSMEEKPCAPYGPFPCKVISKVFWLPSVYGGITAFVGGMPRAQYGNRHTVSVLRGSKLDRAAAEKLANARLRAGLSSNSFSRPGYDEDDDDEDGESTGVQPGPPPLHVFDTDAPEHVCFDFASRVIDIVPVGPPQGPCLALLVLCDQELVVIDLASRDWPFMHSPYLACLHTASVTASQIFTQVDANLIRALESASLHLGPSTQLGSRVDPDTWSRRPWPIDGLSLLNSNAGRLSKSALVIDHHNNSSGGGGGADPPPHLFTDDLLVTGHEDGSLILWRLGPGGCLLRLYTLHTAALFDAEFGAQPQDDSGDAWPPFRPAGLFDPFSDDPRFSIQAIHLIGSTLVVGGAAGQVIAWQLTSEQPRLQPLEVSIKTDLPGFKWKGYSPLHVRRDLDLTTERTDIALLHPVGLLLIQPPARITALLACELDSQSPASGILLAVGTPHGYTVAHLPAGSTSSSPSLLLTECTLPDNAEALSEAAVGEGWARRRTRELKRSVRDSFRRLRRVRSTKEESDRPPNSVSQPAPAGRSTHAGGRGNPGGGGVTTSSLDPSLAGPRSITTNLGEREICDRPLDSANTAVVTSLSFGPPPHGKAGRQGGGGDQQQQQKAIGTLFVGTRAGMVSMHSLFAVGGKTAEVRVQRTRHLIMQHRAPVVRLQVVDPRAPLQPVAPSSLLWPAPSVAAPSSSPALLLVASEEQVRLFALPNLKLKAKARLTAKDGYRVKTGQLVQLSVPTTSKTLSPTSTQPSSGSSLQSAGNEPTAHLFALSNSAGRLVLNSIPRLEQCDTALSLVHEDDLLGVGSVKFAFPNGVCVGPALGFFQRAPGQITLFDIVRSGQQASQLGASYRVVYRLTRPPPTLDASSTRSASLARNGVV